MSKRSPTSQHARSGFSSREVADLEMQAIGVRIVERHLKLTDRHARKS